MARSIVAAFRMPISGIGLGYQSSYLARVRLLCSHAEALGARLVAWGSALVAMAWDTEGIEEAVALATSIGDPASARPLWACGMAEGDLEPLSSGDPRLHLAWGPALVAAASLARVAEAGEVLVDGDMVAFRSGRLACAGSRSASDGGRRVSGWKLDLREPWSAVASATAVGDAPRGPPPPVEELSRPEALELSDGIEPLRDRDEADEPPPSSSAESMAREELALLERARRDAEQGPASARCRASLALAMAYAASGRQGEALMDGLDALARAFESADASAQAACYALLAKLYASAGKIDAAVTLRGLASPSGQGRPLDLTNVRKYP